MGRVILRQRGVTASPGLCMLGLGRQHIRTSALYPNFPDPDLENGGPRLLRNELPSIGAREEELRPGQLLPLPAVASRLSCGTTWEGCRRASRGMPRNFVTPARPAREPRPSSSVQAHPSERYRPPAHAQPPATWPRVWAGRAAAVSAPWPRGTLDVVPPLGAHVGYHRAIEIQDAPAHGLIMSRTDRPGLVQRDSHTR